MQLILNEVLLNVPVWYWFDIPVSGDSHPIDWHYSPVL